MRERLDVMMNDFKADDYSVKLVNGLCSVVPFAPKFDFYESLEDAERLLAPQMNQQLRDKAKGMSTTEEVENALWVADALNTGSKGIAVYTGLKTAFNMFFSSGGASTFDSDPQQAADAALKAMGMAYMIHKLFPGSIPQQVEAFKSTKAGELMALYFAAMEVAVPFTDNVVKSGGQIITNLLNRQGSDHLDRFAQLTGGKGANEAMGILQHFSGTLGGLVGSVNKHVTPIANMAKQYLPGALDTMDKVTGAVATAADLLPVWRLLGSRLAAEAVIYRASRGL